MQEKELPALDDDLAIGVSEFDTLDELRADVQRRLDEAAQAEVDELFRRMVHRRRRRERDRSTSPR